MPRISMWNPVKDNNYTYADQASSEFLRISGVGILLHKYEGPAEGGEITDIQDFLFLENRDRNYSDHVYELRGYYIPEDVDFDLSQFGLFLSNDVLRFTVHYNDMIKMVGRKIISGDVLELPSERDVTLSGESINKYYVVQDSLYSAPGHSFTWRPHLWRIKAKQMPLSHEYRDVIESIVDGNTAGGEGQGTGLMPDGFSELVDQYNEIGMGTQCDIRNAVGSFCRLLGVTDEIVAEAEENAFYDPKFMDTRHLYVTIDEDTGYPLMSYAYSGDGVPPNGAPLRGIGTDFPEDMVDGEYYLRVDFNPDRLFQKQGNCFKKIEDDMRKYWTAYNRRLDTYIDNTEMTTLDDGSRVKQKQPLSKVLSAKTDLNAANKKELTAEKKKEDAKAKRQDGAK